MEIIDAQIHEPHSSLPAHGDMDDDARLVLSAKLAVAAMDAVGVDIAVVHPTARRPKGHTEFWRFVLTQYPDRFAALGRCDHRAPDVDDVVAELRATPGVLGLRFSIGGSWQDYGPSQELRTGGFERLFAAAEKHQLPLFGATLGYPGDLVPVATAHPDLTFVVVHFGLNQPPPRRLDPEPFGALPDLLALAQFPNIAVQFSGAPTMSREPYPHQDLWPHLHRVLEAFSPARCMWGSDYTRLRYAYQTTQYAPREQWLNSYSDSVHYLRDTTELSPSDKDMLFNGAIRQVLRWDPTTTPKTA